MNIRERIKKLNRLHFLIERKATGNPSSLAKKLEISKATLYRYLSEMKKEGAIIKYSKDRETYYFEEDFVLNF